MSIRIVSIMPAVGMLVCTCGSLNAQVGLDPDRVQSMRMQLAQVKSVLDNLPENERGVLSGGAQNLLQLANNFNQAIEAASNAPMAQIRSRLAVPADITAAGPSPVRVSNPVPDFLFSIMGGFTQSETSTSWCGSNVVVGFNDSGSVFESLLFGPGGGSFSGAAISTDKGLSFRDVGFINPGPNPLNFVAGDPVVNCANSNVFYYTQIFQTGTLVPFQPLTAVALSTSTDGGANWADPIAAVSKDARTHFLDKPWSALDPTDPNRLFVTYTDFDASGSTCGFNPSGLPNERIAIELVRSMDGGSSWSTPVVLEEDCNTPPNFSLVQGSQVAVDSHGRVFVLWEAYPSGTSASFRELRIASPSDHGGSFSKFVRVDTVTPAGNGQGLGFLQGGIRNSEFPSLAVDRSGGATNGYLYVSWNDGRNLRVRDLQSLTGAYGYGDVLISRSTDCGRTWSRAVRVNDDLIALTNGRGTDQFQPGAAVDNTGAVGVCWYDRRADPANFLIGRFCGVSIDNAATWTNIAVSTSTWAPFHGVDILINPFYLGDYDALAADFTALNSGFLGGYGNVTTSSVLVPNQDIFVVRFP